MTYQLVVAINLLIFDLISLNNFCIENHLNLHSHCSCCLYHPNKNQWNLALRAMDQNEGNDLESLPIT